MGKNVYDPAIPNPILDFFEYDHLPESLQPVSQKFAELAKWVEDNITPGPETSVALRKLLEGKDAAVRGRLVQLRGKG